MIYRIYQRTHQMLITSPLKRLVWTLFAGLFQLQISCAVSPPNVAVFEHYGQRIVNDPITDHMLLLPSPLCMEKIGEFECGHGVYIISQQEVWVGERPENFFNGKPWSQLKRESVYIPAKESYAPLAQYIINSCAQNNCNDQVDRFKVQLDQLKGIGQVIGGKP